MKTLFVLNDAPYGNERTYNSARMAGWVSKVEGEEVKVSVPAARNTNCATM